MPKVNATWHGRHPMPPKATLEQRITWHLAHAKACGCREIPKTVLAELRARRVEAPGSSRSGRRQAQRGGGAA
jgi:hypothetical protein